MTKRVVLDCDNTMGLPRKEIDDGLVLYYLLGCRNIDLIGITTTFGNGSIELVQQQTKHILQETRSHIPLSKGASGPHSSQADTARKTAAARFLADSVSAHPGQITLLATGPLSNLKDASDLNPHFFAQLERIVCMGGYLEPLRIGWRNLQELNFSSDPEATFTVLNQTDCPVTIMNGHLCLQASFNRHDLHNMRGWKYQTHRITRNWLWAFGLYCGVPRFYLWDLVPAVFVNHPELFQDCIVWLRPTIETLRSGYLTLASSLRGNPIHMPARITDSTAFKQVLFQAWARVLGQQERSSATT